MREEIDKLKASISVGGTPTRAYANITAKRETLPAALKLTAEMLRDSVFSEKEFELLKQENLAALEGALSDPGALADEAIGQHFNIYPKDDVRTAVTYKEGIERTKSAKLEEIRGFHRNFYGADNAQIAIVGDFDEKATNGLLAELFGGWKSAQHFTRLKEEFRAIPAVAKSIETPDKESATFIARVNLNLTEDDPDFAAMKIADWMLGGGADFAARLVARIRVKEGLSYAVYSNLDVNAIDRAGNWTAYAQYAPQNKARVDAAFKDEMGKLIGEGFPANEVAAAKSGYAQVTQLQRSNDMQLAAGLSNHLFTGRTFAWNAALDQKVQDLTPPDVHAVLKKYLGLAGFTWVNAGDFAKSATK